jgi:undecaprenyl diphosphate synthase
MNLLENIDTKNLPKHLAIIRMAMDAGQNNKVFRALGHESGTKSI